LYVKIVVVVVVMFVVNEEKGVEAGATHKKWICKFEVEVW